MRQIEMASGETHEATMCGAADGYLHICISDGSSFAAVVQEFSNEENTSTIIDHFGEMTVTYTGYTFLTIVQLEGENRWHIVLKKE
jgi:hypothetical protein